MMAADLTKFTNQKEIASIVTGYEMKIEQILDKWSIPDSNQEQIFEAIAEIEKLCANLGFIKHIQETPFAKAVYKRKEELGLTFATMASYINSKNANMVSFSDLYCLSREKKIRLMKAMKFSNEEIEQYVETQI